MRIAYDRQVDALLIVLTDDLVPDHGEDLEEGVTLDLTEEGHLVALEILDASQRLGAEAVARIEIEGIPSVAAALVAEDEEEADSPAVVVDAAPRR